MNAPMRKSALAAIVMLFALAGCQTNVGPEVMPPQAPQQGETRAQADSNGMVEVDEATAAYVACLVRQGIEASVGSNGEVMLPLNDSDGGTVSSNDMPPETEEEKICKQQVPDYTPVDLNQR